jgi:hypothetical protein
MVAGLATLEACPQFTHMRQFRNFAESDSQQERAETPVRVELGRTRGVIGYFAILGAALCGFASAGAWTIVVAAIALASLSQVEYGHLYRRAAEADMGALGFTTALKSLGNALLASGGAYLGGIILRLI